MDLILCHQSADFDTLGAAVGAARLYPSARIALTGGSLPGVQEFLALYRDEFPLIELRSVDPRQVQRWILVDCYDPDRLGKAAAWLSVPGAKIEIFDHHLPATPLEELWPQQQVSAHIEAVGSTCTLLVERLQGAGIRLSPFERLALALGLHMDTGSLTFPETTARDAAALTWLMRQGVNLVVLRRFLGDGLTPPMQELLSQGLAQMQVEAVGEYRLGTWLLELPEFVPGLAGLVMRLMDLTGVDVLLLVARQGERLSLIGRARQEFAQLGRVMARYGGGGHDCAAAATLKASPDQPLPDPAQVLSDLSQAVKERIPPPVTAKDLMSSPVRTIRPEVTIQEAQRVLLRYGHSGLVVVDGQGRLVGVISRRDIDIALHHGFGHAPVKGYMTTDVKTLSPDTPLAEIQRLMVQWDIGRLPVLQDGQLVGIVTRTDVLRHLHQLPALSPQLASPALSCPLDLTFAALSPQHRRLLEEAARIADEKGLRLYLVGGAVRDLLLHRWGRQPSSCLERLDLDLVVDGPYPSTPQGTDPPGWGLILGKALKQHFPEARLEIHGKFQTAALIWPGGFCVDIASARTEFYPYPASPPEVAMGSIHQDLYRRDFSINALALRLNGPQRGQLLDFFGGQADLQKGIIRALHPNSFIEDPTRIYRAVRFAVHLGFALDPTTEEWIRTAVASGLHDAVGGERLKQELAYILRSRDWPLAFERLAAWGALRCIHPALTWDPSLYRRLQRVGRWAYHFRRRYPELGSQEIWQLRLEALLLPLPQAPQVASQLHLTQAGIERLSHFSHYQALLAQLETGSLSPAQVVRLLQGLRIPAVILLAGLAAKPARRLLWRYLQEWHWVKPPLNGHDLRCLGYKPGPLFQEILERLRCLTLNGELTTRAEAEAWLRKHFPLLQSQPK
ncbi:poly(A) polymerase [Synechococcus sp. 65AY6Li]|jgi:tRNA nucleotidyltransferase (CCA-adding enzyme)|uniref:CBS domain-containing protein n=1 Tax=unclassified Synechococcus TaxID=2626047 RepID=UPI0000694594|nr:MULTISPECIES: CBS domain-containing protein [unclassified Synechococcus]ABD00013.1 polyA polymerase family protein [Synechococcus sp. JA-3-3Ab]PIK92436.1 poly(A) polymerase [Synechococcus sp. 65AY6Li]